MRKLTSIIAAAAILAACGRDEDPVQQYRDALPKDAAARVGTPEDEGGAGSAGVLTAAVTAQADGGTPALKSEYAVMSYYLAVTMNTGVGFTLRFLQLVTTFPPTACDDSSCTWGPWVDHDGLNRWTLVVRKAGDAFDYELSGQRGSDPSAPFVPVIFGTARPVDRDHGSGTFTIDFEAEAGLDHGLLWQQRDFGRILVKYDNRKDVSVGATFLDARNDDPANAHALNAVYAFQHGPSGGELQIALQNLDTAEEWALRTRWSPSGAGRSDARYDPDGAGAAAPLFASECWAGRVEDYVEVYDSKPPQSGAENACSPFSSASYADVVLP